MLNTTLKGKGFNFLRGAQQVLKCQTVLNTNIGLKTVYISGMREIKLLSLHKFSVCHIQSDNVMSFFLQSLNLMKKRRHWHNHFTGHIMPPKGHAWHLNNYISVLTALVAIFQSSRTICAISLEGEAEPFVKFGREHKEL